MGAPGRQLVASGPGNSGEVLQRRGACLMSSPRKRTENTRRRCVPVTPREACSVSMWKHTASPGSSCPAENGKGVARRLDVRQIGERAFGKPLGLRVHEGARHEPGPAVRAGDEFQRRLAAHRIDRNPEADVLPAFDIVVGLILMPGRGLARAGLLGEHVIVIEPRRRALHEARRRSAASADSKMKRR